MDYPTIHLLLAKLVTIAMQESIQTPSQKFKPTIPITLNELDIKIKNSPDLSVATDNKRLILSDPIIESFLVMHSLVNAF